MCGCSCGAGSEEGLNCAEGEGKSSQILLCSTWQQVGKRSCTTHPQHTWDLWVIEGMSRRKEWLKCLISKAFMYL